MLSWQEAERTARRFRHPEPTKGLVAQFLKTRNQKLSREMRRHLVGDQAAFR